MEALVWYAKVIPWEFPGFSVDSCFEQLLKARKIIEAEGAVRSCSTGFSLRPGRSEGDAGISLLKAVNCTLCGRLTAYNSDPHVLQALHRVQ